MNSINRHALRSVSRPGGPSPSPRPARLLDQLRQAIRYRHDSLRTEKAYVYWTRLFVRWAGLRHPRELGQPEVEAFLKYLAAERRVSASTHRQALSALLFLYREVVGAELPWLEQLARPAPRKRIPAVLSVDEVGALLERIDGELGLIARLLYGSGMRLMEALRLRVKDVDFDRLARVAFPDASPEADSGATCGAGTGFATAPRSLAPSP